MALAGERPGSRPGLLTTRREGAEVRDLPSPAWPLLVLAAVQFADGLLCIGPARFVAGCLRDVRFPRRYWRLLPPVKFAAAAGLILGIWVPYLGLLTCAALIAYFIVAISMHLRARDLGRNLFVNAAGMLTLCLAAPALAFLLLPPPGNAARADSSPMTSADGSESAISIWPPPDGHTRCTRAGCHEQ